MSGIEHKHLRSALEFAVLMAAEGQKRKPVLAFPRELRPFLNKPRLPSGSLGRLRRVIENDANFRARLSAGAVPELVDEIGRLWLENSADWEDRAEVLAEAIDDAAQSGDAKAQLKRAEKRRDAAEQAAFRARAELVQRDEIVAMQATEIDDLRAEVAKADDLLAEMKTELSDIRMEIRHARDREAAAVVKARTADDRATALQRELDRQPGEQVTVEPAPTNRAEVIAAAATARHLADQLDALAAPERPASGTVEPGRRARPTRRTALTLPGGVIASSAEAASFLARSDALFIVDGYNVAKLGWPNRTLEEQRTAFLDRVEALAQRHGTDITVVFDGASVVGAHTSRRRLVRVVFSPEGTIADDVIRDEVDRTPTDRAVVVVTNDAEIVRDVRAKGANVVPSNALIATL